MQILKEQLKELIQKMEKTSNKYKLDKETLNNLYSDYPFNKIEYIISCLIASKTITFEQYLDIRNSYLQRNKYLRLFEMAPRTFGETWGQNYLMKIVPELQKPSKDLDPNYSGQYDLWYNNIKIEVKASRAVKKESGKTLLEKALLSTSSERFNMNFQQIKPLCCDVFIWIAVWKDKIRYWVLNRDEVKNNKHYSNGQHRGNVGEGQLWIKNSNIDEFNIYEVDEKDILAAIVGRYNKLDM